MPKRLYTLRDPVVVTRELDLAYIILWALYAWWGIQSLITTLPSISMVSSNLYSTVWAGSIAILSSIAMVTAILVFFRTGRWSQPAKKRLEEYVVMLLCGVILVYPAAVIFLSFHGDTDRLAIIPVALSYLIFPLLRVRLLNRRIKQYASME